MREFTDSEKNLVKALIQNVSRDSGLRIGDVLRKVYPIEYIEKNTVDDPFYKETIKICHKDENEIEAKIYEAFSLIILLLEQRYIVAKELIEKGIIGRKNPFCDISENRHIERTYFNYYNIDLWSLLNSHYSVTNSLIDFAKDFKTVEQRRFEEELKTAKETLEETKNTLKITQKAFIGTLLTLLATIGIGIWQKCSQQEIDTEQINSITTAIKEHKTVTIDSIKILPADTFNVNIIQPKAKPAPKPTQNPLKQPLPNN